MALNAIETRCISHPRHFFPISFQFGSTNLAKRLWADFGLRRCKEIASLIHDLFAASWHRPTEVKWKKIWTEFETTVFRRMTLFVDRRWICVSSCRFGKRQYIRGPFFGFCRNPYLTKVVVFRNPRIRLSWVSKLRRAVAIYGTYDFDLAPKRDQRNWLVVFVIPQNSLYCDVRHQSCSEEEFVIWSLGLHGGYWPSSRPRIKTAIQICS